MNTQLQEVKTIVAQPGFEIKAALDTQIMTAKTFPRDVATCIKNIINIISNDQEIADSCVYALPKGNEKVEGPSLRLAEIFISEWGNLVIETKIISNDGQKVISSGRCWDLEKNISADMQASRSIIKKNNTVYDKSMQDVTASAAAGIALRNAIFKVIPKSFIDKVYKVAKDVSINGVKDTSFEERRIKVFESAKRVGIKVENILSYFNKTSINQIDKEEIQHIIAVGTSVKEGLITPAEAFSEHLTRAAYLASTIDDSNIGED